MKRLFYIFSLIFTLSLLTTAEASASKVVREGAVDLKDCPVDAAQRRDALYEITGSENSHEAVLDNRQDSLRTPTSRPQRINPTMEPGESQAAAETAFRFHPTFRNYCPSRHVRPTSPIRPCASAHYYVFQLRHIIC